MFGDVIGDKSSQLLIDFVVLMVFVHSADVVDNIFVDHYSELLVLEAHLSQKELYCTHGKKDTLGPKNHDAASTFFSDVGVKSGS